MKPILFFGAIALTSVTLSQAVVVWADDFSTDRAGGPNPYNYPGGAVGDDYVVSLGGNTSSVSGGIWNINDGNGSIATAFVTTSQWTARPNEGDQIRISFDMRVNSMASLTAPSASVPRVSLFQDGAADVNEIHSGGSGSIFNIGFGTITLTTDGDPDTDLALYTTNASIANTPGSTNLVGFTGSGWVPGFNFGNYDAVTATNNDTGGFFNITLVFTEGSTTVDGTVTNIGTGQFTTFSRPASSAVNLSDLTNPRDGIRFGTGQGGLNNVDFDNVSVEILPVPEPSSALLVGACGALGLLRRRRA